MRIHRDDLAMWTMHGIVSPPQGYLSILQSKRTRKMPLFWYSFSADDAKYVAPTSTTIFSFDVFGGLLVMLWRKQGTCPLQDHVVFRNSNGLKRNSPARRGN